MCNSKNVIICSAYTIYRQIESFVLKIQSSGRLDGGREFNPNMKTLSKLARCSSNASFTVVKELITNLSWLRFFQHYYNTEHLKDFAYQINPKPQKQKVSF